MTTQTATPFALPGADTQIEIPAAARDFVKRSTATAKQGADKLHAGAERVNTAVQGTLAASLAGSYDFNKLVLQNAYSNVQSVLGMFEKLAGAKCLGEATQIQLDFVRDYGRTSIEQVRETASALGKAVTGTVNAARDGFKTAA